MNKGVAVGSSQVTLIRKRGEDGAINYKKVLIFIVVLICAVSLGFNVHFYRKNKVFEETIGSQYKDIVRLTIFEVNGSGSKDFWLFQLKKTSGQVSLGRSEGLLQEYADKIKNTNGKVGFVLGNQLMILSNQYDKFGEAVVNNNNYGVTIYNQEINSNKAFIIKVLKQLETNLGKNDVKWYQELSNPNSKTSDMVWKQYKAYEKSQK